MGTTWIPQALVLELPVFLSLSAGPYIYLTCRSTRSPKTKIVMNVYHGGYN
jgi:hypothetical protein